MSLLNHLVKGGKNFPKHILDKIVSICAPQILRCFIRVQEDCVHRKQTMDFLRDISSNVYYKEEIDLKLVILL